MRLFIKLMLFIVIAAIAAPFILKKSDGQPWMTADDLETPDLSVPDFSIPEFDVPEVSGNKKTRKVTVYRWQDKDGVWHFTDEEEKNSMAEAMTINPDVNSFKFNFNVPTPEPAFQSRNSGQANKVITLDTESSPYTQIPELIDRAKNVDKVLNQRHQQQEQIINNLGK